MAATNSNSSDEPQTFGHVSWLSADAQYLYVAALPQKPSISPKAWPDHG